jgi:hypothetical protein
LKKCNASSRKIFIDGIVRVQDMDQVTGSNLNAPVEIPKKAEILFISYVLQPGIRKRGNNPLRIIRGSIINHENLYAAVALAKRTYNRITDQPSAVKGRDADRDQRGTITFRSEHGRSVLQLIMPDYRQALIMRFHLSISL